MVVVYIMLVVMVMVVMTLTAVVWWPEIMVTAVERFA